MLEQHHWSAVSVTERSLQKLILCLFLRMPTAEKRRINADQVPRFRATAPSAWHKVAPPALHALCVDGLPEPDGKRPLADVMIAGDGRPRHRQTVFLRSREGEIVVIIDAGERHVAAMDNANWRNRADVIHKHVPVVDALGAPSACVRVRHLRYAGQLRASCPRGDPPLLVMAWPGRRSGRPSSPAPRAAAQGRNAP
jgi:hypothetical protein